MKDRNQKQQMWQSKVEVEEAEEEQEEEERGEIPVHQRIQSTEVKNNAQNERKYLQIIYLIRD